MTSPKKCHVSGCRREPATSVRVLNNNRQFESVSKSSLILRLNTKVASPEIIVDGKFPQAENTLDN